MAYKADGRCTDSRQIKNKAQQIAVLQCANVACTQERGHWRRCSVGLNVLNRTRFGEERTYMDENTVRGPIDNSACPTREMCDCLDGLTYGEKRMAHRRWHRTSHSRGKLFWAASAANTSRET